MKLTACSDLSAADWITGSDLPWEQLVGFGPSGFTAYARLRLIPDPAYDGQSENDVDFYDGVPESAKLDAALQVLGRHTRTPDDCYFCLWDGWDSEVLTVDTESIYEVDRDAGGVEPDAARPGIAPAAPTSAQRGPKVVIPNRAYFLFRGALSELSDRGAAARWPGRPGPDMPDPAFIWPADHAWCVAKDVDPHWAGIGAEASAIEKLVADPRLDVVPADPRLPQPSYR